MTSPDTLLDQIELRLQRWAEWRELGDAGGFAAVNVLHESWTPPTPGRTPTLRTSRSTDARQTHRAICTLSLRLQQTLEVVYVRRLRGAFAAEQLGCDVATVPQRVRDAKRRIASALDQDRAPCAENHLVKG